MQRLPGRNRVPLPPARLECAHLRRIKAPSDVSLGNLRPSDSRPLPRMCNMRADANIKRDVEDELRWDPGIAAMDIGVSVHDGIVTLGGFVRSYPQKGKAERDAKRVEGVAGVANDLEVRLPLLRQRTDPQIVRDAINALKSELPYSSEKIKVIAADGHLKLEGTVAWNYIRERAKAAVKRLRGVTDITILIDVRPTAAPREIRRKIEDALRRSGELDAGRITVEAQGGEVILRGAVSSWTERAQAERTTWAAPGVSRVDNRITVAARF